MDFNRAAMLLHIVDTARQWPNLKPLHDEAMRELEAISAYKGKPAQASNTPAPSYERPV